MSVCKLFKLVIGGGLSGTQSSSKSQRAKKESLEVGVKSRVGTGIGTPQFLVKAQKMPLLLMEAL